jgi:vacuole morphology and inheritance protein 14
MEIDKLVQLLESPIFLHLRLQLLSPEKYPFLFKTLYGLLMLLPQTAAFTTLKNRLTTVTTLGVLHLIPKRYIFPTYFLYFFSTESLPVPEEIDFSSLLSHFVAVRQRHHQHIIQVRLNAEQKASSQILSPATSTNISNPRKKKGAGVSNPLAGSEDSTGGTSSAASADAGVQTTSDNQMVQDE